MLSRAIGDSSLAKIQELMRRYPSKRTALIPSLYVVQQEHGYIPDEAVIEIAELFALAPAEVEEVITFYTMFYRRPVGKYVLQVCTNISCLLCGGEEILEYLKRKLNVKVNETTEDGKFTLLEVECIGACEQAPAMQVNLDFYGNLTVEGLDRILESLGGK